jgi:transcriptional regulator of acetoin/glycerol metabolism
MNSEIASLLINKEYDKALQFSQVYIYMQAIEDCNGNVSKAARLLGVSRSTLYKKVPERWIKKLI